MAIYFVARTLKRTCLFESHLWKNCNQCENISIGTIISSLIAPSSAAMGCQRKPSYNKCIVIRKDSVVILKKPNLDSLITNIISTHNVRRFCCKRNNDSTKCQPPNDDILPSKDLGVFVRFKILSTKYWYVLIPVHLVTTAGWLIAFYYLSKCGVDPALLRHLNASEHLIERMDSSGMGHLAISLLCLKIISPLRYMVTIAVTAGSIRYLAKRGYINSISTDKSLSQMRKEWKEALKRMKRS